MKPLALTHFKLSSNCSGVKWVSMLIILPYQNLGVIRGLPMKSMPGLIQSSRFSLLRPAIRFLIASGKYWFAFHSSRLPHEEGRSRF
jgi:hypothetical protein